MATDSTESAGAIAVDSVVRYAFTAMAQSDTESFDAARRTIPGIAESDRTVSSRWRVGRRAV